MPEPTFDEGLFQSQREKIPLSLAIVDPTGTVVWANPEFLLAEGPRHAAFRVREQMEKSGYWPPTVVEDVSKAITANRQLSLRSVRIRPPSAHGPIFMDVEVVPFQAWGYGPHRSLLILVDVTPTVESNMLSFLLHEYFRTSPHPIQILNQDHVMIAVNDAMVTAYGYTREELIGRSSLLFRHESVPSSFYENMWRELQQSPMGTWSGETITRTKDGTALPEFLHLVAIRNNQGEITHHLATVVDLRELKKWERKASQSEKLASIGELAAGVAHEINSPLANAMLIIESVRRKTTDPWTLSRFATLSDQLNGAARIIRGLLDFARASDLRLTELDLRSVVREAVGFLRGKVSPDLEIEEHYPPEPLPITGDRLQLFQVLTNILNNASDAMEGRGKVVVSVEARGDQAVVDVVDHGPGIPEANLTLIFDPFYTTKAEGKGTGLGLAISLGILQAHHGSLSARNVPGAGAGFLVTIPMISPPSPESASPSNPDGANPSSKVLVQPPEIAPPAVE